jgi:hypothetical protein
MSFPTIEVSPSNVPSSIQIATPFSYTFSNSGAAPGGSYSNSPVYTGRGTFDATNPLVTIVTPSNSNDPANSISGLNYTVSTSNISNNAIFEFTLPYPANIFGGSMQFLSGITATIIGTGFGGNHSVSIYGTTYPYLSNSSIRHTYSSASNSFTVTLVRPSPSSNVTIISNYPAISVQFNSSGLYWPPVYSPSSAPEWDYYTTYTTGAFVSYLGNIYEALSAVANVVPTDTGYWKLLGEWDSKIDYAINDVVSYDELWYKALIAAPSGPPPNADWILLTDEVVTFTITAPQQVILYPSTFPLLNVSSITSTEILPFISGNGTTLLTFSSSNGFQGVPSSNLTLYVYQSILDVKVGTEISNTITINPITITTTPTLGTTLSLYTYQPFSYMYSIPGDVVNVLLQYNSNTTSTSLVPYISGDTFESTLGLTVPGTTTLDFVAILSNSFIGRKITTITTLPPAVTITPAIPTGSLNLYKYEPFSYVFTLNSESVGLTLQISRSSSQITPYCSLSVDKSKVTYAGTYLTTSSSVLNLFVDILYGTTIISTTTIRISIGRGRFFPPISNQFYQLYQNESISTTLGSNPVFSTVSEIDSIISIPSLPNGLSFSNVDSNTSVLQGTPTLPVAQSTYTIFGNNSSNGNVVSTPIVIKVNAQQVFVTPSTASFSNLIVGTSITPIQFFTRQPTGSILSFSYTWDTLPDGFNFQNLDGSNVSQGYGSNSIQIAGAPSLTFAKFLASNSLVSYSIRLTATQVQTNGVRLTGSSLITFSLGETVLFADTIIPQLYATEIIDSKNVFFSATTFLNGSNLSNIQSITAASLPIGLSLSSITLSNRVQLKDTPSNVGTADYSFIAINQNGVSRTQFFTIPILPDIVSFGSESPPENTAYSFIVSKPIVSIPFSATSSANKTPISWTLSLPPSYGLLLSSTTGSSVSIVGTPTFPLNQTPVIITARDTLLTISTRTILITIEDDTFTWPTYVPTYIQNIPITTFSFDVTTTSGRLIQSFTSTGLPNGLVLNSSGVLSGTPLSGSGNILSLSCSGTNITFVLSSSDRYLVGQTINVTNVPNQVFREGVRIFPPLEPDPEDPFPRPTDLEYIINGDYVIGSITSTSLICASALPSTIETSTGKVSLKSGSFTINASTGYSLPPTYSQIYPYTIIPDTILTLLNVSPTLVPLTDTDGVLTFSISNVFSALSYSGFVADNFINPSTIQPDELNPVITLVNNVFSGSIPQLPIDDPSFTFTVTGIYENVETDVNALLSFPDRITAVLILRTSPGFLSFRLPTISSYRLFQYCPIIPITFAIVEEEAGYDYTYYYSVSSNLPLGLTFTTEPTGTTAILSGIPVTYSDNPVSVTVYAANGPNVISNVVNFRILTPSFVNPQVGAGAYTALLRADVEGNAAQNARDQRVFPTSDPLAGPLLAPRAPDVITQSNCFLGLCKKPCPSCRTMM